MNSASDIDQSSSSIAQKISVNQRFAEALALVPELARVEAVMRASFRSDVASMRDIPEYLLGLGGKRIRPVITLLCCKALGAQKISDEVLNVAAGIELIHMATLMHDDIIDESPVRRHKPSPYAKYGTTETLLSGDFLLTRAFGLCAKLDNEIINATELACIALVEGEALESPLHKEPHTKEMSLIIAQRKTASLFRLAAFSAAHLSAASEETKKSMSIFGESLGIAFQIIDDILDVISDEATLGKKQGLDLLERKPSLVNVLWLESGDAAAQRLKIAPLATTSEQDWVDATIEKLRSGPVILEAKRIAISYAETAKQALRDALKANLCAPTSESEALFAVIDFALDRVL